MLERPDLQGHGSRSREASAFLDYGIVLSFQFQISTKLLGDERTNWSGQNSISIKKGFLLKLPSFCRKALFAAKNFSNLFSAFRIFRLHHQLTIALSLAPTETEKKYVSFIILQTTVPVLRIIIILIMHFRFS